MEKKRKEKKRKEKKERKKTKKKDQKGRTQGLRVEHKPIWLEIKIHLGRLLKLGSKDGLD